MHPDLNVLAGQRGLQSEMPDEVWPASIGSPADSIGEPPT